MRMQINDTFLLLLRAGPEAVHIGNTCSTTHRQPLPNLNFAIVLLKAQFLPQKEVAPILYARPSDWDSGLRGFVF